ncbi:zinc transporter Slc39a7-like isoform X2 [Artemia franciscana]|uniref:Catsup protein n=2 Tax=Artemia franciscana TaxID=6661 RepID=A0AA88LB60_ARTSF|nr:hypothetical protein QYM36_005300 [Artemia franciscana]KAK2719775.1 hypothetical protein QYM36_005300 [Artemia franciscana]KAK2719776.1 hypothetical protein QYM36_005300 [Artemia franciscana]KAK2719777.1 hypothetical protein QYM36_005300 [Artemia franciscana]
MKTCVLIVSCLLLCQCKGCDDFDNHGHSHESPSFKYSKDANLHAQQLEEENFHLPSHSHDGLHAHSHDLPHSHSHDHIDVHKHSHGTKESDISPKQTKKYSDTKTLWIEALGATLFISIVPFIILFLLPLGDTDQSHPLLKVLLSFASGGLLGDAFLHLIPHAMIMMEGAGHGHSHSHDHEHEPHDMSVGLWVISGILTFLMVEKCVHIVKGGHGHSHSHSEKRKIEEKEQEVKAAKKDRTENSDKNGKDAKKNNDSTENTEKPERSIKVAAFLNLAADFTHNFTDGLAIGASFLAGRPIGIITTATVLVHEIPHEIGDFAILIQSGCPRRKAMFLQLITAFGALSGTVVSLLAEGIDDAATAWILPFTAGGFIYIATVSVIPEIMEKSSFKQSIFEIIAFIVGVYSMVLIANFE